MYLLPTLHLLVNLKMYGFGSLLFLLSALYALRQSLISITLYKSQNKAICFGGILLHDTNMAEMRLWLIVGPSNQMVLSGSCISHCHKDVANPNSVSSGCRNHLMLQIRGGKTQSL